MVVERKGSQKSPKTSLTKTKADQERDRQRDGKKKEKYIAFTTTRRKEGLSRFPLGLFFSAAQTAQSARACALPFFPTPNMFGLFFSPLPHDGATEGNPKKTREADIAAGEGEKESRRPLFFSILKVSVWRNIVSQTNTKPRYLRSRADSNGNKKEQERQGHSRQS